jgi:cytochrome c oxidase assembly factor CtaG
MSLARILGTWWWDPPLLGALLLGALIYVRAALAARRWPRARSAAFLGGLAAIGVALQSGLDGYAGQLLSVHMAQHLVLLLVAAPLLLAGRPVTLALRALPRDPRRGLAVLLRGRAGRLLGSPAAGLGAFAVAILGTHLTPLYELALTNPLVHVGEHLVYLLCGLLFWAVLICPGPPVRRLTGLGQVAYLIAGMPLMSAVGVVLETDASPRYAEYLAPARRLGVSALGDQRLAGTLMWIAGTVVMATLALGLAWRSILHEERRALAGEARA